MKKNLLIIVSGAAEAFNLPRYLSELNNNFNTRCVVTAAAEKFISIPILKGLTEEIYLCSQEAEQIPTHIRVAAWAQVCIILPASAGRIARMSHGITLDLADEILLCLNGSVHVFPSMNELLWRSPATQNNIRTLQKWGNVFLYQEKEAIELATGSMRPAICVPPIHSWINLI